MRITPLKMAVFYTIMGFLFLYVAIATKGETIWQFHTILFMFIATFDFGVAIRAYLFHEKIKKIKKKD